MLADAKCFSIRFIFPPGRLSLLAVEIAPLDKVHAFSLEHRQDRYANNTLADVKTGKRDN
jgi:hypothetical protein